MRRRRLGMPRLLIVGCGDVGARIVARLHRRFRIFAVVSRPDSAHRVRQAGAVPIVCDLDRLGSCAALGGLARRIIVLVPTSSQGKRDRRTPHLLRALFVPPAPSGTRARPGRRGPRRFAAPATPRLVYASTSGVYGDRRGAWTDETTPPRPGNDRAHRRLDAERRLRASRWHAGVLRVPGIYAADRLPRERLQQAIPVPPPAEDVFTNHIHAEDLARACLAAVFRGAPARVYNVVDDTRLALGEYLDVVADRLGLPRPPRASGAALRAAAGPQRMSFLNESRRLRNTRMKRELRLRLAYPDIHAGLQDAVADTTCSRDTPR